MRRRRRRRKRRRRRRRHAERITKERGRAKVIALVKCSARLETVPDESIETYKINDDPRKRRH